MTVENNGRGLKLIQSHFQLHTGYTQFFLKSVFFLQILQFSLALALQLSPSLRFTVSLLFLPPWQVTWLVAYGDRRPEVC